MGPYLLCPKIQLNQDVSQATSARIPSTTSFIFVAFSKAFRASIAVLATYPYATGTSTTMDSEPSVAAIATIVVYAVQPLVLSTLAIVPSLHRCSHRS